MYVRRVAEIVYGLLGHTDCYTDKTHNNVGLNNITLSQNTLKVKVTHTRLPSVWFRSWSRFLAVSLHVTGVINPAVGCYYFQQACSFPRNPEEATNFAAWWTEARWVWTGCLSLTRQRRSCDLNPGASVPESSMLNAQLPSHQPEYFTFSIFCFDRI